MPFWRQRATLADVVELLQGLGRVLMEISARLDEIIELLEDDGCGGRPPRIAMVFAAGGSKARPPAAICRRSSIGSRLECRSARRGVSGASCTGSSPGNTVRGCR
jgi:hypothetical protein